MHQIGSKEAVLVYVDTMMHLLGMWRESWRDLWVYYFIDSSIGDKSSRSLFFILHFSGRKNHPGWKLECCSKLSSSSKLQAPRTSKCKIQKKIGLGANYTAIYYFIHCAYGESWLLTVKCSSSSILKYDVDTMQFLKRTAEQACA